MFFVWFEGKMWCHCNEIDLEMKCDINAMKLEWIWKWNVKSLQWNWFGDEIFCQSNEIGVDLEVKCEVTQMRLGLIRGEIEWFSWDWYEGKLNDAVATARIDSRWEWMIQLSLIWGEVEWCSYNN